MALAENDPGRNQPPKANLHWVRALREALEARHYSPKTVKVYLYWIQRYVRFHSTADPRFLREPAVNEFLTYLAVEEHVAASTQNQALAALLAFYEHVAKRPLDRVHGVIRAAKSTPVRVVLSRDEARRLFACMEGVPLLVAQLIYGAGLRLGEALRLRVKDIDFDRGEILVRDGKGGKDRVTMLPESLRKPLREHLRAVRRQHQDDLAKGLGRVPMPNALSRKYRNADKEWLWQWVFAASSHFLNEKTGIRHRHHLHETRVQKAVREAAKRADIAKHVTPHALRHSFATQLMADHYEIRTIADLMGHKDIRTTQIYLHALNRGGYGVRSPLDVPPDRGREGPLYTERQWLANPERPK